MNTKPLRVISIAVAAGKVGMVYMVGGELFDWKLTSNASLSNDRIKKWTEKQFQFYKPDIVISERITSYSRKSDHTRGLINAVALVAQNSAANHIEIERVPTHANKYDEIAELSQEFPQIADHAPKQPSIYMPEPKATIYFEALSMAVSLGQSPPNLPV